EAVRGLAVELARLQQGLARDAADAQASATEGLLLLHAGHPETELCGADGGDIPSRPSAHDHQVVLRLGHASDLQPDAGWPLDAVLDVLQEGDRLAAVHQTVVVGERHVHHRPQHDLAAAAHRPLLDRVHAEYAALRRIDDRCGHERAIHAAIADR